jgi:hypothetical protein
LPSSQNTPRTRKHARLAAEGPGNGSLSPAKSPSNNTAADPHARIFGLSLAALFAACLVLNAVSRPTLSCQQSDRDFGAAGANSVSASGLTIPRLEGGSHMEASSMVRSKGCATNEGGKEPGY